MSDVTVLLRRIAASDPHRHRRAVWNALRRDAPLGAWTALAERSDHAARHHLLAHEAFLRLKNAGRIHLDSRVQFMAYVSKVLRAVIVDFVRKRSADKRGGHRVHVTLDTEVADEVAPLQAQEIERVNDALLELEETDPRLKQVVEMRFFGGLSEQEIGEILGVSDRTVRSNWVRARLLLSVTLKR